MVVGMVKIVLLEKISKNLQDKKLKILTALYSDSTGCLAVTVTFETPLFSDICQCMRGHEYPLEREVVSKVAVIQVSLYN